MINASPIDPLSDVMAWLRDHLRLPKSTILTPETRINLDLGVDGDDGAELLIAFADRFGVDMAAFHHVRYFGPEAGASPMSFFRRILEVTGIRDAQVLDPLFIRDLVELVNRERH